MFKKFGRIQTKSGAKEMPKIAAYRVGGIAAYRVGEVLQKESAKYPKVWILGYLLLESHDEIFAEIGHFYC